MSIFKRVLVGRPIATTEQEHQRISKKIGLAVFSSDAISSTAYATEEILMVTAVGGSSLALGLSKLQPLAIGVAVLLAIVVTSYRRTIFAYPNGGGSYVVSRENLGRVPSLVAGASILVDYILTVAVSISAGVAAIVSIPRFEGMRDHRVILGLILIALITAANLRGMKESGRIFAAPTYVYIITLSGLIIYGLSRSYFPEIFGEIQKIPFDAEHSAALRDEGGSLGLFLILKGFSSGAVALTGIEAIADGVPAFKRPAARNASVTLSWMAVILGALFLGTATLADRLQPFPSHEVTVLSQLGHAVFSGGPFFVLLQFSTAAVLVLAANTAYADFPRLSSIIAADSFLPRQFANRGDRLVFSNGVLFLAIAAGALIVAFGGVTTALIPLYAVGVFTSFTLSQAGMVRYQLRERQSGWKLGVAVSAAGAVVTLCVLLTVASTKFVDGAWLPVVVVPCIIAFFLGVRRHYDGVANNLRVPPDYKAPRMNHTVVVLVSRVHRGVLQALAYAESLHPNHLVAVSVMADEHEQERLENAWEEFGISIPLEIVYSPYRELTGPILTYIDELDTRWENDIITVVIPEFVVKRWWEHVLHNQNALILKGRLLFRKETVVTSVPYHLE